MEAPVNFEALLKPKTLAVIGVSLQNERHAANVIYYENNLRFQAEVFPVNDRGVSFRGKRYMHAFRMVPERLNLLTGFKKVNPERYEAAKP